ncbi:hypothetical protein L7F22_055898 [Adiantum nelumboides]|nr:hypothetical protein [Adiantum nelumboides]
MAQSPADECKRNSNNVANCNTQLGPMPTSTSSTTTWGRVTEAVQQGHTSSAIAGGVAGALSKTCTAPLARLTILLQVQGMQTQAPAQARQSASLRREVYRIASEEGIFAFWKGNAVTILHRIPYSTINFYAYQNYKDCLTPRNIDADGQTFRSSGAAAAAQIGSTFAAGAGAGMTATFLAYPLDLVRTRISAQTNHRYYTGIAHALHTIAREEGFRSLYKGLGPSLLNVAPAAAINFTVYCALKSAWATHNSSSTASSSAVSRASSASTSSPSSSLSSPSSVPWPSLIFGSIAGTVSSTATFLLDLVRKRKQLEGAPDRGVSTTSHLGVLATLRHIGRTEGYRGLFRGIGPDYLRVVPTTAIMFTTFEFVRVLLRPQHRHE